MPKDRQRMIDLAADLDLARLSIHGDVLVERRPPALTVAHSSVVLPAGSFLQATRLGEESIAAIVLDACKSAKRVADLFAGCGPVRPAARRTGGRSRGRIRQGRHDRAGTGRAGDARACAPSPTEIRDLFRRPLLTLELNTFDAVVMDPPRAGAEAQAQQIAHSKVPLVVSVSCDAGTFARDTAILQNAGFRLENGLFASISSAFRRMWRSSASCGGTR